MGDGLNAGAMGPWLVRAKQAHERARRELDEANARRDAVVAAGVSGPELELVTRAAELAELKVSATRRAWFDAVVHSERGTARARRAGLGGDPERS